MTKGHFGVKTDSSEVSGDSLQSVTGTRTFVHLLSGHNFSSDGPITLIL